VLALACVAKTTRAENLARYYPPRHQRYAVGDEGTRRVFHSRGSHRLLAGGRVTLATLQSLLESRRITRHMGPCSACLSKGLSIRTQKSRGCLCRQPGILRSDRLRPQQVKLA